MITQEDRDFVNMLFDNMIKHVDMDMVDLHDEDTAGIEAVQLPLLELS